MGARGRKGALSVVPVAPLKVLEPPEGMVAEDEEHFRAIVAKNPPDQFRLQDAPLLAAYCEACRLAREAQERIDLFGLTVPGPRGVEKSNPAIVIKQQATNAMVMLAAKLKLCPSCRQGGRVKKAPAEVETPSKRQMFGA